MYVAFCFIADEEKRVFLQAHANWNLNVEEK